jgi:hypothetical protein
MKEMLLAQQEAANQWAIYQAKAMRENICRIQRLNMEAEYLDRADTMKPSTRGRFEATVKKMTAEEIWYASEKKPIEAAAHKAERERNVNKDRDLYFDFAEVQLQVSIVLASVAILSSSRSVFYFSLIVAAIGAFLSFNGFTLTFHLPFLG